MRLLNAVAISGTLFFCIEMGSIAVSFINGDKKIGFRATLFTGGIYTTLASLFFIFGILILVRLRYYFNDFYKENKWIVFIATMGLCCSCVTRGTFDLLRYNNESFCEFIKDKEVMYNFVVFFTCDTIPLCFQLSTLIFGYIRRRNEKRYRLMANQNRLSGNSNLLNSNMYEYEDDSSNNQSTSSYFDPPLMKNNLSRSNSSLRHSNDLKGSMSSLPQISLKHSQIGSSNQICSI